MTLQNCRTNAILFDSVHFLEHVAKLFYQCVPHNITGVYSDSYKATRILLISFISAEYPRDIQVYLAVFPISS